MNLELEIEKVCEVHGISREDFRDSNKAHIVRARREVARKALEETNWPVTYIGCLLGHKPDSARLGKGIFKIW